MGENNEFRVIRLPAEKIPPGLPARAWINRKNKHVNWAIEKGRWVKGNGSSTKRR